MNKNSSLSPSCLKVTASLDLDVSKDIENNNDKNIADILINEKAQTETNSEKNNQAQEN
jgi:hypothetical protein